MEHRGQIVEKIIRTRISISEFSRRLDVSRRTVYNWFNNPNLSLAIIEEIAVSINYDFSKEFPQLSSNKNEHGNFNSAEALFWKKKYADLLEVHHAFIREHMQFSSQGLI